MPKLKYEDTIDFSSWTRFLYRGLWLCLSLVFLGDIVAFVVDTMLKRIPEPLIGLFRYIVMPSVIQVILMLFFILITNIFIRLNKPFLQSITMLTGVTCVCTSIVAIHYKDSSIFNVFAIPILVSLLYIDRKPLFYAFLLSLASYLTFTFAALPNLPDNAKANQGIIEVTTMSIFLIALYVVATLLLETLSTLVKNIIAKNEQIKRDSFTKLLNHTSFYEHLDTFILDNLNLDREFSLIVWDIDNFKSINDTYGHELGDKAILSFSSTLLQLQKQDAIPFRYGGDEFTMLLRGNADDARLLAEKIRSNFDEKVQELPIPFITISAGICQFDREHFHGRRDFFSAADFTLYAAKKEKNAIHVWEPAQQEALPSPESTLQEPTS